MWTELLRVGVLSEVRESSREYDGEFVASILNR